MSGKPSQCPCHRREIGDYTPPEGVRMRRPTCYGYCGDLGWTVEQHGRVTHKQWCPHRTEPWCQTHPEGCPDDCVPRMWLAGLDGR